jgi:hypothetical protein
MHQDISHVLGEMNPTAHSPETLCQRAPRKLGCCLILPFLLYLLLAVLRLTKSQRLVNSEDSGWTLDINPSPTPSHPSLTPQQQTASFSDLQAQITANVATSGTLQSQVSAHNATLVGNNATLLATAGIISALETRIANSEAAHAALLSSVTSTMTATNACVTQGGQWDGTQCVSLAQTFATVSALTAVQTVRLVPVV